MSFIIKGIDLPKEDEDITLEINHNGEVRAYSTELKETGTDIQAKQIDRPQCNECKYNENGYCTMWFSKIDDTGFCYKGEKK